MLWFVLAFAMFTLSLTKFHHYVLPCAPPIAMLTGIVLDRALPSCRPRPSTCGASHRTSPRSAVPRCSSYGALRVLGGSPLRQRARSRGAPWLGSAVSASRGVALFVLAVRRSPCTSPSSVEPLESTLLFVRRARGRGRARARRRATSFRRAMPTGPRRLMHLVSYNYKRPWPETLDFRRRVRGRDLRLCARVGAALRCVRLRPHAAALLLALGVWAAAWGLDVYLVRAAPHWGQRETILEYYKRRQRDEEPLVAFQMNWKGENFYTGNRIPAFVSTGAKFKRWLEEQREHGTRVLFFTTEHSRESGLKSELGKVQRFEQLTSQGAQQQVLPRARGALTRAAPGTRATEPVYRQRDVSFGRCRRARRIAAHVRHSANDGTRLTSGAGVTACTCHIASLRLEDEIVTADLHRTPAAVRVRTARPRPLITRVSSGTGRDPPVVRP